MNGKRSTIDMEKHGVEIRDYTNDEVEMKKFWMKRNKVKKVKSKKEALFPNNKMFIRGY